MTNTNTDYCQECGEQDCRCGLCSLCGSVLEYGYCTGEDIHQEALIEAQYEESRLCV